MVFRLGGEEFGILFYIKESRDALIIGNEIIKSIENLHINHKKSSTSSVVTISMGLYIYLNSDLTAIGVYKKTDELLYKAKQNGRNQVCSNIKDIE